MKKRRQLTLADWSRIPTVAVKQEANYDRTLGDYNRRTEREAQETAAVEQQNLNETQKELTKAFWGRELAAIGNPKVWREEGAFDPYVGLEDGRFASQAIDRAFTEFSHSSHSLTGYALDDDGLKRLCWFGLAQSCNGKDLSTPEAWAKCFDRLLDCGAFAYGETVYHENAKRKRVVEEVPARLTIDDLMAVNESTREGLREAHRIADALAFDERQPMVRAWFDSLKKFGITVTNDDAKRCKLWFERCNKSFLNPRHFDECRLWNARAGYWVDAYTEVERVNDEIENTDLTRITHEGRRNLNNRKRAAQEADVRRFGYSQ